MDDRLLIRTIRKALKSMANSAMEAYRIRCSWHGDLAKEAKRGNKRSRASKRGPTSTRKKNGTRPKQTRLEQFLSPVTGTPNSRSKVTTTQRGNTVSAQPQRYYTQTLLAPHRTEEMTYGTPIIGETFLFSLHQEDSHETFTQEVKGRTPKRGTPTTGNNTGQAKRLREGTQGSILDYLTTPGPAPRQKSRATPASEARQMPITRFYAPNLTMGYQDGIPRAEDARTSLDNISRQLEADTPQIRIKTTGDRKGKRRGDSSVVNSGKRRKGGNDSQLVYNTLTAIGGYNSYMSSVSLKGSAPIGGVSDRDKDDIT